MLPLVQTLANKTKRKLVIFDDNQLPSLEETMMLFYRADVVIGVHGAGLANLLFSRPGTTVIEINCKDYTVYMCYRVMCMQLGMRCFSTETTQSNFTFRCNESGVRVNVTELKGVLDYVAGYVQSI